MNVAIKKIDISNFKGIKEKQILFSYRTKIHGANGTGKTTIFDSFLWCMFGVDSGWNSKFFNRPLDSDGNLIHNVEISVTVTLEVDGVERIFKRVSKENWVLKRGCQDRTLQGNVGEYFIDEYPRSAEEYERCVSEIVEKDMFKILTNPTYFPSLPWKEQRNILMRFANETSDVELAGQIGGFDELIPELKKAPSTDDIQKKYAKALSELKKKQVELPVRIDEVAKQKVDVDVAELELARNELKEQLAANKEKQSNVSVQMEEYQKLSDGILELQFELNDMKRNANEKILRERATIYSTLTGLKSRIEGLQGKIKKDETYIYASEHNCETFKKQIEGFREQYRKAQALEFDENSLVCSFCGQEYPEDRKAQIRADFEQKKAEELKRITENGNDLSRIIKSQEKERDACQERIEHWKTEVDELSVQHDELEKEYNSMPTSADIFNTPKAQEIQKQIAEKEKAMESASQFDGVREQLRAEESDLQEELVKTEKLFAASERNVEIDERIAELQQEQREVAQKVADAEKMVYLIEQFIRAKMDRISESINSQFDGIGFKLFETQINGGIKETCECTVNGVNFGSLNSGHRIVAGLQIIKALQKLYDVRLTVFVDNAESVNNFNIPRMDNQMILLAVSEDKELRVIENGEIKEWESEE